MHLKKGPLSFGGGECGFFLINKNPDVSPLIVTHLPISSSLVHLGGGATAFFCCLFVSAQTLDSRTPGKCLYSFVLLGAVAGQLLYLPAFKIFNAKLNKNDKQFSLP